VIARGSGTDGESGKTGVRRVQRELGGTARVTSWRDEGHDHTSAAKDQKDDRPNGSTPTGVSARGPCPSGRDDFSEHQAQESVGCKARAGEKEEELATGQHNQQNCYERRRAHSAPPVGPAPECGPDAARSCAEED